VEGRPGSMDGGSPTAAPPCYVTAMTAVARLEHHLQALGRTLLGYSGGVDSSVLAVCGTRALGAEHFLAVIGRSASYPAAQYEQAVALARAYRVPILEVPTGELEDPAYRANQGDRCFHCKQELWERVGKWLVRRGFPLSSMARMPTTSASTARASPPERPRASGRRWWSSASRRLRCARWRDRWASRSGCTRRTLSRQQDHSRAASDRGPPAPGGARRGGLRSLGIGGNLRVRHRGSEASVEVDPAWIGWMESRWAAIEPLLRQAGFERATLDPRGYRRGALAAELPVVQG